MRRAVLAIIVAAAVAVFAAATITHAQEKAPGTVVLKGAPLGGVKFDHAKHAKMEGVKCTQCHHPSKPEKAMKGTAENCTNCHVKTAVAPMTTGVQKAFHNTCQACHKEKVAAGKPAPMKCTECHKKENV